MHRVVADRVLFDDCCLFLILNEDTVLLTQ